MVSTTRKRKQNKSEIQNSCLSTESSPGEVDKADGNANDGTQIRNFLESSRARRWVGYEWCYSDIDTEFFMKNTFKDLLATLFPRLKCSQLTRIEWRKIRSLIVNSSEHRLRRCSSEFFRDERIKLERCRQKIRVIRMFESGNAEPRQITLPSNSGASVTVFSENTNFDVKCGTLLESQAKQNNYKIQINDGRLISVADFEFCVDDDGMTTIKLQNYAENFIGNFPEGLLKTIVNFQKVLELKREKIKFLRSLIDATKTSGSSMDHDFASSFLHDFIADLETLNLEITSNYDKLKGYKIVQGFLSNVPTASDTPVRFREKSMEIISEQLKQLTNANFHSSVMHLIQVLATYTYVLIECDKLAANEYRWLDQFLSEHLEQLRNAIHFQENADMFDDKVLPLFQILINNCVQNKS